MTLTEYSLKNKVVTYFLLLLVVLGGVSAFFNIGKLEDAKFTIKTALVITQYPGASPHEVEQEVSEVLERAVQEMENIDEIYSSSYAELSILEIEMDESLRTDEMSQQWDILRKKIIDASSSLPSGAYTPSVMDDFGDVYGMFYAVTGDGFSYEELNDYSEYLKKNLLTVDQVGKIALFGNQIECLDIVIKDAKISEMGVNPGLIIQAINAQTNIAPAGKIEVLDSYVRVTGNTSYDDINAIKQTVIRINNEQFYLKNIAEIKKSYLQPSQNLMYHNGNQSIGLAVSTKTGGNVMVMAENLEKRINELKSNIPVGIELTPVYLESREVDAATNVFFINLFESVAIVVVVLLIFMGFRSGLLIGISLIFTILGTLVIMHGLDISLHRTSLAAIIIAMGMLVDNAIVVTDGVLVDIQRGFNRRRAILNIAKQTGIPLLGATVIAILAFLPVFLAPNSAGEITRDLFIVVAISLSLSWILAMTQSAVMNERFLKKPKVINDPYDNKFYKLFKNLLIRMFHYKWLSISALVSLFIMALILFGQVKQGFFLPIEKSYVMVDYWLDEGSTINKVDKDLIKAEKFIKDNYSEVVNVTTYLNQTPPRYVLMMPTQNYNSSYGHLLIETHDSEEAENIKPRLKKYFEEYYPQAQVMVKGYIAGPPIPYKVEARFIGPDPVVLRNLAEQAKTIMHNEPACTGIQDDWRNEVMTWNAVFSPEKASRTGVTRADLGNAIQRSTTSGLIIGLYRENDEKLPIVLKVDNDSKNSIESISNTGVWPQQGMVSVPLKEVVDSIRFSWENSVIQRYNQQRAITVQCNSVDPDMSGSMLLAKVKDKIEAISLPKGYSMMWDGEYKPSKESNEGVGTYFPLAILLIILIIVMLFNSVRQSLIVIMMIPLQLIGVVIGLFLTNSIFSFLAVVGFLGLIGMVLKNAIVLMDQIKLNMETEGVVPVNAVLDAAVSRLRPVFMAAATTILGMLPLVTDAMFGSMAVTIIFGLLFATVLTLLGVPLLYILFFKIRVNKA